jgi:diaminohydroxyphosphoribosylaminopyrimidine deaminase/5-amino-6-(5-phosphoribosylamino)uracil reductase
MRKAMILAQRGLGLTSPNPMVGALLVKNGKIIAQGWHRRCGGDHAEIVALKKAGAKARGCRLYVTLEPCSHYGRTPPCVQQIIAAGIREVYVGMIDPNPLNNGKSIRLLKKAGVKVEVGFLPEKLQRLNEAFVKYITTRMPFVTAKCAQTLDGKIAASSGHSQWITSARTRDHAHKLRSQFDAILVGVNTVLQDNPRLNAAARSKRLKKIILDSFNSKTNLIIFYLI